MFLCIYPLNPELLLLIYSAISKTETLSPPGYSCFTNVSWQAFITSLDTINLPLNPPGGTFEGPVGGSGVARGKDSEEL
jgi:hypothetical protein